MQAKSLNRLLAEHFILIYITTISLRGGYNQALRKEANFERSTFICIRWSEPSTSAAVAVTVGQERRVASLMANREQRSGWRATHEWVLTRPRYKE